MRGVSLVGVSQSEDGLTVTVTVTDGHISLSRMVHMKISADLDMGGPPELKSDEFLL